MGEIIGKAEPAATAVLNFRYTCREAPNTRMLHKVSHLIDWLHEAEAFLNSRQPRG
jgi:hypothetical protein